jgi:hypothetical protein
MTITATEIKANKLAAEAEMAQAERDHECDAPEFIAAKTAVELWTTARWKGLIQARSEADYLMSRTSTPELDARARAAQTFLATI